MLTVGLTGGIGAGKSAVADLLAERGAVLIDADRIAREVVEPGGPAYQPLVDRFGPTIVEADGRADGPAQGVGRGDGPGGRPGHPPPEGGPPRDDVPRLGRGGGCAGGDGSGPSGRAAGHDPGGRRGPHGRPGVPGGAVVGRRPGGGQLARPRPPPEGGRAGVVSPDGPARGAR